MSKNRVSLPKRFNANFITHTFFPEYIGEEGFINSGRCYDWAYYAYCLFPTVQIWTTDFHAWIQYGKRFFDSVHPLGSESELTYHGWDETEPCILPISEFKNMWDEIGGGRKHHWNRMLREMRGRGLRPVRS